MRQSIPAWHGIGELQLDVLNPLNLMNRRWGLVRIPNARLLEHVAHTPAPAEEAQPVFRFDPSQQPWTVLPDASAFHLQLSLRYRF